MVLLIVIPAFSLAVSLIIVTDLWPHEPDGDMFHILGHASSPWPLIIFISALLIGVAGSYYFLLTG